MSGRKLETRDDKKEWLNRYYRAQIAIQEIKLEIETLTSQYIMPAKAMDGMPRGSGGGDLSTFAAAYEKLWKKLDGQLTDRMEIYHEIIDVIEAADLNEAERSILRYRYILCLKWDEIAEQTTMDRSTVFRIRNSAVDKLAIECDY